MQLLADSGCLIEGSDIASLACIPVILGNIIYWLLIFAGIIALFFIIFSGIRMITSGGDPKQLDTAKKTLTYAIVGLLLILFSFAILRLISQVTGTDAILKFDFGKESSTGGTGSEKSCSDLGGRCFPSCSGSGKSTIGVFDCVAPNGICCR